MTATILIIDDEASLLNEIEEQLMFEDYQTLTATNGREGIEIITAQQPDLILSDISMPEVDGIGVVQHVRESLNLDTPIILMSAFDKSQFEDRLAAIPNANIHRILRKPVPLMTLLDAVSGALTF